jgi:Holliday junction resolvasome RuvABC DNA-binding subunit
VCAVAVELWTKAFQALRNLGFRETESRRALNEIRTKAEKVPASPTIEQVVIEAILVLT